MSVTQLIAQLTPHSCHFSSLSKARIGHRAKQTLNGEVTLTFLWRFSPQSGGSLLSLNITLLQHKLSRGEKCLRYAAGKSDIRLCRSGGLWLGDQRICSRSKLFPAGEEEEVRWWCIRTGRRPPAICLRFMYIISDIYIKHFHPAPHTNINRWW